MANTSGATNKHPGETSNLELEIICTAFTSNSVALRAGDLIQPSCFSNPHIGAAFAKVLSFAREGKAVDKLLVEEAVKADGNYDFDVWTDIWGYGDYRVDKLADRCAVVEDRYVRREIQDKFSDIVFKSQDVSHDVGELLEAAESAAFGLRGHGNLSGVSDMAEAVQEVLDSFDKAQRLAKEGKVIGVKSGHADIDKYTAGWQPGELIVVAARPGVGKSAFAGMGAFLSGEPSLICSLEMPARQYAGRWLLAEAKVDRVSALMGRLTDEEWDRLAKKSGKIAELPVWIDSSAGKSINDIRSLTRSMKLRHNISAVYIDYLQLVGGTKSQYNREQEVASVSRGMKQMALELDIPVICMSQLNREVRHDQRPDMTMIRESGQIEQDCDVIIGMWRDADVNGEMSPIVNIASLKGRDGQSFGARARFVPGTAKLAPLEERVNTYEPV